MNEMLPTLRSMRDDHHTWQSEHAAWNDDIDRWQAEHLAAQMDLASLEKAVQEHGVALEAHREVCSQLVWVFTETARFGCDRPVNEPPLREPIVQPRPPPQLM